MSTSTDRNGVSLQRLILAPQRRVLRPLASAITSRTHCADAAVRNPCKKENPPQTNPQRPLASSSPKTHFLDHWGLIISLGNPLRSPFPPHSKTHLLIMRLSRGQDPSMCVVPSFPFHFQGRKRTPPPTIPEPHDQILRQPYARDDRCRCYCCWDSRTELTDGSLMTDNWGMKAKRRKTTGTGRMRTMKEIPRKFKNGFQTGVPKGSKGPSMNT